jgi:hypothetical protein
MEMADEDVGLMLSRIDAAHWWIRLSHLKIREMGD